MQVGSSGKGTGLSDSLSSMKDSLSSCASNARRVINLLLLPQHDCFTMNRGGKHWWHEP